MTAITTVTEITKGDVITARNGRRYTALSTKTWDAGTYMTDPKDPNYVTMVRPMHVGRAFDLFISQGQLDRGAYTVTR